MPNRMLRDWTDSEAVNQLSLGAERFFVRLIMKADDFGRYHADARLLRSFLYPLISEKVKDSEIVKFLAECEMQCLIDLYEIDGKKYLEINEFRQRLRIMKSKFPPPDKKNDGHLSDTCPQPAADGGNPPTDVSPEGEVEEKKKLEVEVEVEVEEEGEPAKPRPPIPNEFLGIVIYDAEQTILADQKIFEALCIKTQKDVVTAKDVLRKYHLHLQEKELYPKGKKAVVAGFEKWLMNEKKYSNGTHQRSNGTTAPVVKNVTSGDSRDF